MADDDANDIGILIEDCERRESKMSDWERGFIDSIGVQYGRGRSLTSAQLTTLNLIWERVTE